MSELNDDYGGINNRNENSTGRGDSSTGRGDIC